MFIKEFIYFPTEKKSVIMIIAGLEHVQLIQMLYKTRKLLELNIWTWEVSYMYNEIKTQSVNSFTFQLKLLFENRWGSNWIDDSIIDQNNHVNSEISGILTTML